MRVKRCLFDQFHTENNFRPSREGVSLARGAQEHSCQVETQDSDFDSGIKLELWMDVKLRFVMRSW